jgi:hypothetical protein
LKDETQTMIVHTICIILWLRSCQKLNREF